MHSKNILKILLGQPLTVLGFKLVTKYWEIIIALRVSVRNCGSHCWSRDNCCEQTLHPCHPINTQFGRVVKRLLISLFLQKHVHWFTDWSIKTKFVSVKSVAIFFFHSFVFLYQTIRGSNVLISPSPQMLAPCIWQYLLSAEISPKAHDLLMTLPSLSSSVPDVYKHQKCHTGMKNSLLSEANPVFVVPRNWLACTALFSSGHEWLHHIPTSECLDVINFRWSPQMPWSPP